MEKIMRVLWHLNAELGCLYEARTLAQSLQKEAEAVKEEFALLAPGSGEAAFAAGELEVAVQSLRETETLLRDLRQTLEQIGPKEGGGRK